MNYRNLILLNNKEVPIGQEVQPGMWDGYEEGVIRFIDEWLSGKEIFELQTSGSTGKPKLIEVHRHRMEASARATVSYLQISATTPVTVCIDARYIGGKMQLVRALTHNLPLQIVSPKSDIAISLSGALSLGLISLVPLQLYHLLDQQSDVLNRATAVLVGGAPLQGQYIDQLAGVSAPVYHTYGMTETVSHIALKRLNGDLASNSFQLLDGVRVRTDERGCLVVNAEVTNNKDVVTNDVVELTGPSSFVWKGRFDNVVNSGGVKLFPEEMDKMIERYMHSVAPGRQFFCIGVPDKLLGQKLVLCVEGRAVMPGAQILDDLKKLLPPFHSPRQIHFFNEFTSTGPGKIDKMKTIQSVLS